MIFEITMMHDFEKLRDRLHALSEILSWSHLHAQHVYDCSDPVRKIRKWTCLCSRAENEHVYDPVREIMEMVILGYDRLVTRYTIERQGGVSMDVVK